jgi:hypothetical protein
MIGLKTVIWCVNNYPLLPTTTGASPPPANNQDTDANTGKTDSASSNPNPLVETPPTLDAVYIVTEGSGSTGSTSALSRNSHTSMGTERCTKQRMNTQERQMLFWAVEWGMECLTVFRRRPRRQVGAGHNALWDCSSDHGTAASIALPSPARGTSNRSVFTDTPSKNTTATGGGASHDAFSAAPPSRRRRSSSASSSGAAQVPSDGNSDGNNDYKEILEKFASSLCVLDGYNFRQVLAPTIPFFLDLGRQSKDSLVLFRQFLIANKGASYHACDVLLQYLTTHLHDLSEHKSDENAVRGINTKSSAGNTQGQGQSAGHYENSTTTVLLAVFKFVFQSISMYPENEPTLRPHLQTLIMTCFQHATDEADPSHTSWHDNKHYTLLRQLFRTVSGGKFEQSYKEILPLLPTILNGLCRIQQATKEDPAMQDIVVELSLTIPARLSSLLPHLPLLLRFITLALRSPDGDLVNLG